VRDHRRLLAYAKARELVLAVYQATSKFPREEQFGLTAQIRRASVSVPSNLVEGCARRSELDYRRFVDMALGSARELEFQLELARDLGFLGENGSLIGSAQEVARLVAGLANSLAKAPPGDFRSQDCHDTQDPRLKTED